MTEAWQRNRLADLCSDAKLNDQEQQFLHSIVRLTDTSGVLVDSALAMRTVSFTIPWAASLIPIYKQNYLWKIHLENALNSAAVAFKDLKPDPNLLPTAAAWNASLSAILASPIDRSMSEIIANAGQVHSHMREISSLVLLGGHKSHPLD